ncbi:sodium:solute symporter family transporter [Nonomuraea sp. ZG12]|uniref:sodium:solute symporter family transporter n=1 Tax=Nonomuraea sp. ZG12 TaxID=3452207 RepID=UPI003F8C2544
MTVAVLTWTAFIVLLGISVSAARPRRYTAPAQLHAARRAVRPWRNGAAISSEFTSAAVCLGLAGLSTASGVWHPAGVAGGFVLVLALVVAPLRRSRTYTLPDFAEWRLGSVPLRCLTTALSLVIGMAFLVAQLHAAGVVMRLLTGMPAWAGWAALASAGVAIALAGGTGSVTSVQASQYWLKLVIFLGVGVVLWAVWWHDQPSGDVAAFVTGLPGGLWDGAVGSYGAVGSSYGAGGASGGSPGGYDGMAGLVPGALMVLLACALGTMGLPHLIVRLHVSLDGHEARRSIVAAQATLALFCVVPPLYGVLSAVQQPVQQPLQSPVQSLMGSPVQPEGGVMDEIMLLLPARMLPGSAGELLTGLLAAGAFVAFLATACGVLSAVGGAISSCVSRATGVSVFRGAVLAVAVTALGLTTATDPGGSMPLMMLGFSLSAATFCPLLLLGIWWRRLTDAGVLAGAVAGGGVTVVLVVCEQAGVNMGVPTSHPASVAVPLAFAVMVVMSLVTPGRVPGGVGRMMARMHLPEPSEGAGGDRSSPGGDRSPSGRVPHIDDY